MSYAIMATYVVIATADHLLECRKAKGAVEALKLGADFLREGYQSVVYSDGHDLLSRDDMIRKSVTNLA